MQILIIDDHATNIILLSVILNKLENVTTVEFSNPLEALAWCKENQPDLILIDFMMPDMDGIQFIKAFREIENTASIPIIIVTAHYETEIRHQALLASANDFLNKPIDVIELTARVKNLLNLRDAQKKLSNQADWLKNEVRLATDQIKHTEQEVIYRLSRAAEYRDPETGFHILRMANYAGHIAKNLGLSIEDQQLIINASPMHDIGKIGIPDNILLKPGKLSSYEFEIMKQHPMFGKKMLEGSKSELIKAGEVIAYSHHEKFDGSGYPLGLQGTQIPLFGRICALADVFDALTSERPYKAAWSIEKAIELIREGSGKHFDPECVEAFFMNWQDVIEIKHKYTDNFN